VFFFLYFNYCNLVYFFEDYALPQHPHPPQVLHNLQVLPPQEWINLAQATDSSGSQGGLPPLQDAQLMELI